MDLPPSFKSAEIMRASRYTCSRQQGFPGGKEVIRINSRAWILLAFAFLAGCYSHSFPSANQFVFPPVADCHNEHRETCAGANTAQVFADANGTFYPSGWQDYFSPRRHWGRRWAAGSLLNETTGNDPTDAAFRRLIDSDQPRQLAELARFGGNAERIFILVHGYNNTTEEADGAFSLIERHLDLRSTDRIIRFYWDGLYSGNPLGSGKIWFNAAGNSELVGTRALRSVLNQFHGKEIYLISHSRGTSVILSALGNPIFDPDFVRITRRRMQSWPGHQPDVFNPRPLLPNGNRIHVLVLAPAVDRIDFCDERMQPPPHSRGSVYCGRAELRSLGSQVMSFRYSVNCLDPVLRKFVGLPNHFNPTGLGTDPEVGEGLRRDGLPLQGYQMNPPVRMHLFTWYVEQPVFLRMLSDAGIGRPTEGGPAPLPATPPARCDRR
jgi:hypothetical protein